MLKANQLSGFGGSSVANSQTPNILSSTFLQVDTTPDSGFGGNFRTWNSQNLGPADVNRWIVICVDTNGNGNTSSISGSIGGQPLTHAATATAGASYNCNASIAYAYVPTGTSAQVFTQFSPHQMFTASLAMYSVIVTPGSTLSVNDTAVSAGAAAVRGNSVNSIENGLIIATSAEVTSGTASTWLFSIEDHDTPYGSNRSSSSHVYPTILGSSLITTGDANAVSIVSFTAI